jgi:hypothetical protein
MMYWEIPADINFSNFSDNVICDLTLGHLSDIDLNISIY